jgi:hypothetical protein
MFHVKRSSAVGAPNQQTFVCAVAFHALPPLARQCYCLDSHAASRVATGGECTNRIFLLLNEEWSSHRDTGSPVADRYVTFEKRRRRSTSITRFCKSAGLTPETCAASASVAGRRAASFWRASCVSDCRS